MKRIFLTIILLFITVFLTLPVFAEGESAKVMGMTYDNSSALVNIMLRDGSARSNGALKYVRLSAPNRIYFDIDDAVLIGEKQQIVFEKSNIKEIRLAQFGTNPDIVRMVITFEEDFDTSKIKLLNKGDNIVVVIFPPEITNDYFSLIYSEEAQPPSYSDITASSQRVQKTVIPNSSDNSGSTAVVNDIQKAFEDSTLPNTDGKTYDSKISVDISSGLKLRTRYFINQYIPKNNGLLISGLGQLSTAKIFYLKEPKRAVIDMPNSYIDKAVRNKEVNLCPDESCKDTAKLGQFDRSTARIVITSDNAEKFIPIYSQDSQSLFVINSDKLNHTALSSVISNINKVYVKRIDNKTNELILSFTSPIIHSIVRTDDTLALYLFNVQGYNEFDIIKTLNNTFYKPLTFSLLPKIGVKAVMPDLGKEDIVNIEQSVDAKALKLTIVKNKQSESKPSSEKAFRKKTKDKIVLDAGHGGTDYGAIREGINEKDITLDITRRVEAILRSKGYKVALTRSDDTFVSLEDRVSFSESEEPEVFVSIHVNSAVSTDPNGIETHWYHDYSKSFAEVVHKHLVKELPNAKDRGLFKSKFYVINHTTDPAILCEIGFLSNETERNDIITDSRKQKTAKAIADGIIEYLKGVKAK